MHGINLTKQTTPSTLEFHALAQLSPFGGVGSVAFVVLTLSVLGGVFFAAPLYPQLGVIGASLAVISASCVVERMFRIWVLCAIGMHVYKTLVNIAGKKVAGEVALLCGKGKTPTPDELEAMMGRLTHAHAPGLGE